MVTINNYSVSLGLNAGGLIDGSKLARQELASLSRQFTSLATPAEKFERSANLVEKALKEGAIAENTAAEAKERLRQKYLGISEAQQRATEAQRRHNELMAEGERVTQRLMTTEERRIHSLSRLRELHTAGAIDSRTFNRGIAEANQNTTAAAGGATMLLGRLGGLAAGYVSVSTAANIARESILASAEMEKATASFSVLAGSAEKASRIMEGTRSLAARGLSLSALNQSARTMLSFNVAARDVIPTLERIGNITGGDTERLKMMSLAFSQSAAAGRLMGQDLLQMINAGFNPLQEISKQTGRSLVDLKKDMEGGLISFEMVNNAFRTATESGGLYNGMLENMSKTTAGALDQAKAKWETLKIELGDAMSPVVRGLATEFQSLSKYLLDNVRDLKGLVDTASEVEKALRRAAGSSDEMEKATQKMLASARPGASGGLLMNAADEIGSMVTDDVQKREEAVLRMRERWGSSLFRNISPFGAEADRAAKLNEEMEKSKKQRESALLKEEELAAKEESRLKSQNAATTQAGEVQNKAEDAVNKRYQDRVQMLRVSIAELQNGKVAAAGLRAEFDGMSAVQKQEIEFLTRKEEMLKNQSAIEKERLKNEKEQGTLREKLTRDADRLRDKFFTPVEKLAKSLAEINRLQSMGALSPFEAERARREAVQEARKGVVDESPMLKAADKLREIEGLRRQGVISEMEARKARDAALTDVVKDIKIEAPKNLEVGSQEAYKFFAQRENKSQEAALRAERKQEVERQVNAINQVKTAVDQVAANLKRKR